MKAIQIHQFGDPDVLCCEDIPVPEPTVGQARVRLEAIGVNFLDLSHRRGDSPIQLPAVLGVEAAGVVDAVGPAVHDLKPGDRVAFAMHQGAYTECAVVPVNKLVPFPDNLDMCLAAAVLLQGVTAHYLSHSAYPLRPGDTALIHAAAGGVGLLLVQMAKQQGATVIGTVSSEEKKSAAIEAGADHVIIRTQSDFEGEIRRLTEGRGVDVVYDSIGRMTFDKGLNCLKRRGYMVLYGSASGPVPPIDLQTLVNKGSLFVTRTSLRDYYLADRSEQLERASAVFESVVSGKLAVRIDGMLPLGQAAQAHRLLESRQTKGKLLLIP